MDVLRTDEILPCTEDALQNVRREVGGVSVLVRDGADGAYAVGYYGRSSDASGGRGAYPAGGRSGRAVHASDDASAQYVCGVPLKCIIGKANAPAVLRKRTGRAPKDRGREWEARLHQRFEERQVYEALAREREAEMKQRAQEEEALAAAEAALLSEQQLKRGRDAVDDGIGRKGQRNRQKSRRYQEGIESPINARKGRGGAQHDKAGTAAVPAAKRGGQSPAAGGKGGGALAGGQGVGQDMQHAMRHRNRIGITHATDSTLDLKMECSVCHNLITTAAADCDGYVACYLCMKKYVSEHKTSLAGTRMGVKQIMKLRPYRRRTSDGGPEYSLASLYSERSPVEASDLLNRSNSSVENEYEEEEDDDKDGADGGDSMNLLLAALGGGGGGF